MRKTAITCTALAGTLFLGGSSAPYAHEGIATSGSASNSNTASADSGLFFMLNPLTPHDEQVLTHSFRQTKNFWSRRYPHFAGIIAIKLAVLKGDDEFNCPSQDGKPEYIQASDQSGTQYCQKLGAIVLTEGLANYLHQKNPNPDPMLKFFVSHEFGHAIQVAKGTLRPKMLTTLAMELQADCYAGMAVKQLDPASIPVMEVSLPLLPPEDLRHGTPQQRAASFKQGATDGIC